MRAVKVLFLAAFIAAVGVSAEDKQLASVAEQLSGRATYDRVAEPLRAFHTQTMKMFELHRNGAREALELHKISERKFAAQQTYEEVLAQCSADTNFLASAGTAQTACANDPVIQAVSTGNSSGVSPLAYAGLCQGTCMTTALQNLGNYKHCMRVFGYAGLADLMTTCQQRPQCFSESVIRSQISIQSRCQYSMSEALDFSDATATSVSAAQSFCTNNCSSDMAALIRANPECLVEPSDVHGGSQIAATARFITHLCTREGSETDVCAVQLKTLGRFSCGYTSCGGSNSYCDSNCNPQYTDARLSSLCGRCMTGVTDLMNALGMSSVVGYIDIMCMQMSATNSSYCLSSSPSLYYSALSSTSQIYTSSNSTSAQLCLNGGGSCVSRMISAYARSMEFSAIESWVACMESSLAYYPNVSYVKSLCRSTLTSRYGSMWDVRAVGGLLCARNANYDFCVPHLYNTWGSAPSGTCSSSTQTAQQARITNMGCCANYYDAYVRVRVGSRYPYRNYTANVVYFNQLTGTKSASVVTEIAGHYYINDRSETYQNRMLSCFTNSSEYWTPFETKCAGGFLTAPPRRELSIGIAYSIFVSNPEFKASFENSACNDVAEAAKVAVSSVTCSVQSQASSTRQGTGANSKLVVTFQGESQAAADAAAASIDTQTASNSLQLTSTARVVQGCVACGTTTSTSSAIQGAAPPPTPVPELSAGSSPQVSSASSVGVLAAAVFAAAVAVMAL